MHLSDRADDNLRFIRNTMQQAGSFTAVPGWGQVAMGATAIVAAWIAARQSSALGWLVVWLVEGAVAVTIGGATLVRKARASRSPVLSGPGRRFVLAFLPPIGAGAVLTFALYFTGTSRLIAGTWLLLYGAAVTTAGAHSVRIVPLMGLAFCILGTLAFCTSARFGDYWLAAGFGGLHIAFGSIIARRHGG